MMNKLFKLLTVMVLLLQFTDLNGQKKETEPLRISKQLKVRSTLDEGAWDLVSRIEAWKPAETAIIICDMWDKHWCDDATTRVAEMSPEMNNVLTIARAK